MSGSEVNVTLELPPGAKGTIGLTTEGLGGSEQYIVQQSLAEWSRNVAFPSVPPGRYVLRVQATTSDAILYAAKPLEVTGTRLDLSVALHPLPSVTGRLQIAGLANRPKGTLVLTLASETGGGGWSTAVKPDGSFAFPGIVPGRYKVGLRGTDDLFLSSVQVAAAEVSDGIVDFSSGESASLSVVASGDVGHLKGFVTSSEQPVEGALAVLVPVVDRGNATPRRGFQTESDGSFDFARVPAGEYYLFAVGDTSLEYGKPTVVKPWLLRAKKIRIAARADNQENVALLTN